MNKKIAVLIPKAIDIDRIVESHPSLNGDYLRYLIGSVVIKQGKRVEDDEIEQGEYVSKRVSDGFFEVKSLYSGDNYKKHTLHVNFLVGNNFEVPKSRTTTKFVNILDKKNYKVKAVSYSYRLSNSYFRDKSLKVDYITDDKIIKFMINEGTKIDSVVTRGEYKFLKKFFIDNDKLRINIDESIVLCKERFKEHSDYNKYVKELTQILNLHNGIYRVTFKRDSIGRLYTNITQLPKVYRSFITYDNKKLIEVDLSNSIIYFLGILLNDYSLIINTLKDISIKNINGGIISNLLMISKSFETLCIKEIEVVHTLGVEGAFYDIFIADFEKSFAPTDWEYHYKRNFKGEYLETYEQKRKVTKKLILSMLFAKPDEYEEVQDIFRLKLPQFLELLNRFKEENGHKVFSHILFQIEAYYVLNVVARDFNRKYSKKAPIFTIHDCLITTFDYKEELEQTLKESLSNRLKYAPKVESKQF